MSDENNVSTGQELLNQLSDPVIERTEWSGRQTDWLLQWFVQFVAKSKIEIEITLSVGGSMITGNLVGPQSYFEQLAEDLSAPFAALGDQTAGNIKNVILGFKPEDPNDDDPAFQYIHLKDCTTYADVNSSTVSGGVLWRGKIASVDGFTLGSVRKG